MFRIECFVDDKNLAETLRSIAGKVKGLDVQPVANVQETEAKVKKPKEIGKVIANGGTRAVDLFAHYLEKHPGDVNPDYARAFLASIGRPASNAPYVLKSAADQGMLTMRKKGTRWVYKRNGV